MSEQREALASILNAHHPTRGMRVSMGVTCACGYWTGSEPEQGKRPLPWGQDQLDLHRAAVVLAALTTGAADRGRAEEVPAQAESLHEELLRADDDADQLRAVIFRLAEDVSRLKRVCHQEHPPKMGSPTRDWPAGTETRHSDGARCVLLNDGDYTLIHSTEQDVDQ